MKKEKKSFNQVNKIINGAIWPGKRHCFTKSEIKAFKPVMSFGSSFLYSIGVCSEEYPHVGVFNSKKFKQNIPFFSKQEELFLQHAETSTLVSDIIWKPFELVYNDELTNVFVPDFLVFTKGGQGVVVMVMPYNHFSSQETQRKWYALEQYCAEMGFGCMIYDMNKELSLKWILKKTMKPSSEIFADAVLKALEAKKSHWVDGIVLSKLMDDCGVNAYDLQALVFKLGLIYVPKSTKHKVALLGSPKDDMFNVNLITRSYLFREYETL